MDKKIDELGFKINTKRKNEILSNMEIFFKLRAVKCARKKGANIVDAAEVRNALKRVTPTRIVKHALVDPQTFARAEAQEAKYFDLFKNKIESFGRAFLLDAGCGWGRQLIGYRKRGLKGEFVAFDIDKDAVKFGKRLDSSIHFLVADIRKMPFKSHIFDVIICMAVINFLRRQEAHLVVRGFKYILKPGGLLYLYGLFTKNQVLTAILNFVSGIFAKISPEEGCFNFYALNRIQKLLHNNNFTDIRNERGFLEIIPCPFGRSEIITATMADSAKTFTYPFENANREFNRNLCK